MRVIANPAKSIAEIEIMTRATGEACIDSINFSLSPLPFCFTWILHQSNTKFKALDEFYDKAF